jgi:hypothetical protein
VVASVGVEAVACHAVEVAAYPWEVVEAGGTYLLHPCLHGSRRTEVEAVGEEAEAVVGRNLAWEEGEVAAAVDSAPAFARQTWYWVGKTAAMLVPPPGENLAWLVRAFVRRGFRVVHSLACHRHPS